MTRRAVFDCVVFLQAVLNEAGPAFACFRAVDEGRLTLCVSQPVLDEVRDVLGRPSLQRKYRQLTPERIDAFLANVQAKAELVEEVPAIISHPRDPADEPYLNLTLAAGAHFLVSRDNDLLDLMRDEDFRSRYPQIRIVDPVEVLRELRASSTETP
jgi:putative PIN family toxin of toxin-antitoxin system